MSADPTTHNPFASMGQEGPENPHQPPAYVSPPRTPADKTQAQYEQRVNSSAAAGNSLIEAAQDWTSGGKAYTEFLEKNSGVPQKPNPGPVPEVFAVRLLGPYRTESATPSAEPSPTPSSPTTPSSSRTPDSLIPGTRQTISTARGSVEVGKLKEGNQEIWVAMAPMENGSGFKTYKLDIDPKQKQLSETDKEKIQRMIDHGYFGKLKPETGPSSTVVHREGEVFDSRPYKGFGRTYQRLNNGVYELWYDPNGTGENQLVWTSKRPLDLSKELKPRSPLANKLEQIAAPRTSAPVPPLEPPQTAPPPISATSRPTIPRQPSQSQQSFSTLAPLTTLKPA